MSFRQLKFKEVKVRKDHSCIWCGEPIRPGDQAQYRSYIFEGDFHSDYCHPECYVAMKEGCDVCYDIHEGFPEGEFKRGKPEHRSEPA